MKGLTTLLQHRMVGGSSFLTTKKERGDQTLSPLPSYGGEKQTTIHPLPSILRKIIRRQECRRSYSNHSSSGMTTLLQLQVVCPKRLPAQNGLTLSNPSQATIGAQTGDSAPSQPGLSAPKAAHQREARRCCRRVVIPDDQERKRRPTPQSPPYEGSEHHRSNHSPTAT